MALDIDDLKQHSNLVCDSSEDPVLDRLVKAAQAHVERLLGFAINDEERYPEGAPDDLNLAILQLAAHWYENREASVVGVTAQEVPLGVRDIIREHRAWCF